MTFPYPYKGPIAVLNNLPIEPQNYQPQFFFISNILLGQTTIVTTSVNHDYTIGQQCRLIIPSTNGCRQLNEQTGLVISIPAPNQVVLNIDSSINVDPFVTSTSINQPQIIAVGDINSGVSNNTGRVLNGTFIPGSFINVSP